MEKPPQIQNIEQETTGEEKTFWPDKEKFFRERDEYVKSKIEEVKTSLQKNGFEEDTTDELANILLRADYVAQYLLKHTPVEINIPINISYNTGMDTNKGGVTVPVFSLFGESILSSERMREVYDLGEYKNLLLDKIDIVLNIGRIENIIKDLHEIKEEWLVEFGEQSRQKAEIKIQKELEEEAVHFERTVMEEVAHSFYFLSANKDPVKFKKMLDTMVNNYDDKQENTDKSKYEDTDIEKRASIWYRSYLKKYYPESRTFSREKWGREKQKERMEKTIN